MITRCDNCRGTGKSVGLGMMEINCAECAGVGHVKVANSAEKVVAKASAEKPKRVRRS